VVKSEPAVTQASEEDEAVIRAAEKARQQASEMMREKRVARNMFINEDIYFDFDKSNILLLAQDVLRRKAEWLWSNPEVSVIIEGHCDERGTNEYNLALGDRRAESARNFLVDLGIKGSRLTTISYGEERPVDSGHNEEAWAKNRCAHFIIE
jgi:peptidoglycan-associated lipoprotein